MIYRKKTPITIGLKRWNEKIADDPVWEEAIVDRIKLMVERQKPFCIVMWSMGNESAFMVATRKSTEWTKNLIQTVSHNMRVQDTVIMMKHMITAI